MAKAPRVYLFAGSDSRASLAAIQRWEQLFLKKYSDVSRYVLEADELGSDKLIEMCQNVLVGATLFTSPKFILIKRIGAIDRAPSHKGVQALLATIEKMRSVIDENVTIVLWEPNGLTTNHPLVQQFTTWTSQEFAEIKQYQVPTLRTVLRVAQVFTREAGKRLSDSGGQWLQKNYALLEQDSRLRQKLKTGQELLDDNRTWWLYGVLESAILRAVSDEITVDNLQQGSDLLELPPSSYSLADAIQRQDWQEAFAITEALGRTVISEGDYYAIFAVLNWQFKRPSGSGGVHAALIGRQLLGEIELLSKNVDIPQAWLLDMLLIRLQQAGKAGKCMPIVDPKKLWLVTIGRS